MYIVFVHVQMDRYWVHYSIIIIIVPAHDDDNQLYSGTLILAYYSNTLHTSETITLIVCKNQIKKP